MSMPYCTRFLIITSIVAAAARAAEPATAGELVIPLVAKGPALSGKMDDPVWAQAVLVKDFTQQDSDRAPAKAIEAKACSDGQFLYIGVKCGEPEPAKLKA